MEVGLQDLLGGPLHSAREIPPGRHAAKTGGTAVAMNDAIRLRRER